MADEMHDLLGVHADTPAALQMQIMAQIRDSLSGLARDSRAHTQTLQDVRERVVRLEERDKRLDAVEQTCATLDGKVDALLRDKDERAGAHKVFIGVKGWVPVLIAIGAAAAAIFSAVYTLGRATDVISPPPGILRAPESLASKRPS